MFKKHKEDVLIFMFAITEEVWDTGTFCFSSYFLFTAYFHLLLFIYSFPLQVLKLV